MDQLRDALLGSSPKGNTQQLWSSEDVAKDKHDIQRDAAQGRLDSLRGGAFYNRAGQITSWYCNGDGVDAVENDLHSLWYIYCQLGRYTSCESRDQDRLVLDIVRIQGNGPLTRPVQGQHGMVDIARTVDGTIWNDLPFLVADMTDFWIDNCAVISGQHRLNLASFLAKLASTRISKDRMCRVALDIFRLTFEVEHRDLGDAEDPDQEDPRRRTSHLTIAQLLPAAVIWFREAGQNLIQLSDVSWNDCPSTISQGGPLFTESELGKRSPSGFTPWRWIFWLKRLHEIRQEAQEANQKRLEEYATDGIDYMIAQVEKRKSEILRAYQKSMDILGNEKHLLCLRKIAEGGTLWSEDNHDHHIDGTTTATTNILRPEAADQ